MTAELPPDDDNSEVLEKLDALLRKHQSPPPPRPPTASPAPAPTEPEPAVPPDDFDDIPVLTDVVGEAPPPLPAANSATGPEIALRDLEERLLHEFDTRIAPRLSLAFQQALDELLDDARRQIRLAAREHPEK